MRPFSLSPGRFLIYDAQTFAANADGSQRMQVLWDSQDWGERHAFTDRHEQMVIGKFGPVVERVVQRAIDRLSAFGAAESL